MKLLITGIAGFIGRNAAERFLRRGDSVVGLDNLSRRGAQENLARLQGRPGLEFVQGDVRDPETSRRLLREHRDVEAVVHLAGQVAVTTSVANPREDFESNLVGTFNLLEAVRLERPEAAFLNAATNKVYGGLGHVPVVLHEGRYRYEGRPFGIDETEPLEFYSPYGCSKGAADQYVLDYARIHGLRTASFRQSCIYGPNQFGVTDQGWVAWFVIAAAAGRQITIHGDGCQARDLLHVDDLTRLYATALDRMDAARGQAFNIGGGPGNVFCLLELVEFLEKRAGRKLDVVRAGWRPGDQKLFVADIRKAERVLGWRPEVTVARGLDDLCGWVDENLELCRSILGL